MCIRVRICLYLFNSFESLGGAASFLDNFKHRLVLANEEAVFFNHFVAPQNIQFGVVQFLNDLIAFEFPAVRAGVDALHVFFKS